MTSEEKYDAKTFRMYIKIADNLMTHSPHTSYFLTNHTITKCVEFLKQQKQSGRDDPELTREIQNWFKLMEDIKPLLGSDLQDREQCRKTYYEYAYSLFLKADNKFRNDDYSPQLAQDFYTATVLFDGYNTFSAPDAEMGMHKKYAKVARLKIMKAIKSGNLPVPKTQLSHDETNVPDDSSSSNKNMGEFKPHESTLNRPPQSNPYSTPGSDNQYNNPYYQPFPSNPSQDAKKSTTGGPSSYPGASFGQGGNTGLPDFTKFNDANAAAQSGPSGGYQPMNFDNLAGIGGLGGGAGSGAGTGFNQAKPAEVKPRSTQPRRGPEFYQKSEKAKDLCKKALGEIEYKRIKQFKENLESALMLLEEIDP